MQCVLGLLNMRVFVVSINDHRDLSNRKIVLEPVDDSSRPEHDDESALGSHKPTRVHGILRGMAMVQLSHRVPYGAAVYTMLKCAVDSV